MATNPYLNLGEELKKGPGVSVTQYNQELLPEGGKGKSFTIERQGQALKSLLGGITGSEAGDFELRDQLRSKLQGQLAQGQGSQYERGLNNALATARRQAGGTGTFGSNQYARGLGNVIGQYQTQMSQAEPARLQQIANTESQVLAQSLQDRGYTLQQAQTLANLLQQQAGLEQGSILGTQQQQGPSDLERGLGYLFQAGGTAAKFF